MKQDTHPLASEERHRDSSGTPPKPGLVQVDEIRPDGYDGTCLRPLGLCDLGGCCDICWYRPNHPRFHTEAP